MILSKSCSRTRINCAASSIVLVARWKQANDVLGLDHLVSFTGIVTFKKWRIGASGSRHKFRFGNSWWKTDCPYLAPVPFSRGNAASLPHTRLVAESIASARGNSTGGIGGSHDLKLPRKFFSDSIDEGPTTKGGSAASAGDVKSGAAGRIFFLASSKGTASIHLACLIVHISSCLLRPPPKDMQHHVCHQRERPKARAFLDRDTLVAIYPVSTSKYGLGDWRGSFRTPLGELEIAQKFWRWNAAGHCFSRIGRTDRAKPFYPNAPGRESDRYSHYLVAWERSRKNANAFGRDILHSRKRRRNEKPGITGQLRLRANEF